MEDLYDVAQLRLDGHVTSQTYPSGRVANYSYTAAGRLSSFSGTLGDGAPRTYADQIAYNAAGQMTSERFRAQMDLYHTMYYNLRHQMWGNYLGTTAGNWNRGALFTYYSVSARNIGAPGADYSGNNGNVWMQEHYVPTNDAITTHTIFRDIYEYDDLNRIKQDTGVQKDTANVWTTPHLQAFDYDQWGNRTINAGLTTGANINELAFTVNTATNRLGKPGGSTCTGTKNGMCYDQAGNLIFDNYSPGGAYPAIPGGDREYDGENRMTKGWGTGGWNYYVYDGDGQRARRVVWVAGVQVEYWHVYGFDGELIADYLVNGAPATTDKEYGYRGGQLLLVGGCDVARWLVTDHLGTPRIEVDVTGLLANVRRHDYLPFGEELTVGMGDNSLRSGTMGYVADCVRQRYTEQEYDTETGLNYFGERYYSSVQGRFISVDPLGASAIVADPQSFNRFVYVRNNPLRYVDPDGLDAQNPWGGLTDEERRLLASKLTTVKDAKNPTKAELEAAGQAFNEKVQVKNKGVLDVKRTETNIASVQNFIAEFAGDAKIWNEVKSILGVGSMGVGKQSDIAFTVGNRENFLKALTAATDANGYKRFIFMGEDQGHIDSTRELGYGVSDPSMHIERYPDKWYAHWDPTSFFTKNTWKELLLDAAPGGVFRRPAAGVAHEVMGRATTGAVKNFLKAQGLTPKK